MGNIAVAVEAGMRVGVATGKAVGLAGAVVSIGVDLGKSSDVAVTVGVTVMEGTTVDGSKLVGVKGASLVHAANMMAEAITEIIGDLFNNIWAVHLIRLGCRVSMLFSRSSSTGVKGINVGSLKGELTSMELAVFALK